MWRRIIYHPEVNYALRQTLVLCLPVALGWLFGDLQKGLLFSLVPACCNMAGLDTPHKRFFKRLIVGGSLFATGSFLMQILTAYQIPLPLILLALPLLIGVTGEIGPLHARLLPATLIAAIFTLSLVGRMPMWVPPLLYIGGTLWYGLFNWFWFWLWKEQPMRESLSLLFRELADYCDAKYTLLTQLTDPEKALPPLLARQQKAVDLITTCYQQMHMLSASRDNSHKRLTRAFQVALDLQEHISVSLHQPEEVQKLVEESHAEAVIRWNAKIISARLRVLADAILYHQLPDRFHMEKQLGALEKIARQHPDNPVGNFCLYHFSRIARVLRTQKPLYTRDLMADRQRRLPLLPALRSYLSFKSTALRTAARFAVMLMFGSSLALFFNIPKPYWILMTIMFVSQNGYSATRVRIQHRALGTFAGLLIAAASLRLAVPESITLLFMLGITLASYLITRKYYGWSMIGFTVTAVYSLQLLSLNGAQFLLPRMMDTLMGCLIAFAGMIWLWPQWQSGLLRKNAHDALEAYQEALRMLLGPEQSPEKLAYQRMKVNQAHNALFNSLNQASSEPGFNLQYLKDMRMWVTHSQFIVEHINAMTILAREHTMLTAKLAERYLQSCEIALQRCQQRLAYDGPGNDSNILEAPENLNEGPVTIVEQHVKRILQHLSVMHTISSLAWSQRPHHGRWLKVLRPKAD
ncbi:MULTISPECIES: YccS/YhfK family putative transporter [Enterobacterales]|jgi:YccS/YhfK family integral membrane protein|uniref:YccS/YhfK family putative transporter n=1 Tax=Enterobacterales TaxID=91347 RepID=UPI0015CC9231|nr:MULTISPECIES: YccS/YhfK family putative transporter [Enterobacterales]MBB3308203.1 YccS/YhfK family integral membrane protein [Enterobacter sp. Sphag1F]NYI17015.1 YccS/YhfK family integral membrane protein [Enterobacter sp. Sphag71]UVC29074.1 YccS/YhfK family putative transporter [Pantoea sp. SOD02]